MPRIRYLKVVIENYEYTRKNGDTIMVLDAEVSMLPEDYSEYLKGTPLDQLEYYINRAEVERMEKIGYKKVSP